MKITRTCINSCSGIVTFVL